jgi:class 3 adenylate cyclase
VHPTPRAAGGADLPTGEVTFVFTESRGRLALLRHLGDDAYGVILGRHHRILREAVAAHGGSEFNSEGDARYVAFSNAADALAAALDGQQWPDGAAVRVRMGVHTGTPTRWGDDYMGLAVPRGGADRAGRRWRLSPFSSSLTTATSAC